MAYYSRHLPHWQPEGAEIFLTFGLAGVFPRCAPREVTEGMRFALIDRELDRARSGPRWLGRPAIASLVEAAIRHGESGRGFYELDAYVVMPNHVHLLILPLVDLPVITRWLKGSTARQANQILNRTGVPFWQDESFDHWIRNEPERRSVVRYIELNPVNAGLATSIEDWPWSSVKRTGESACPT